MLIALAPVGIGKDGVGMMQVPSKWILAAGAAAAVFASVSASHAQQTIRVGWTIPAEESKYWMMRRPAEFPDLGKTYNIEWTQFQGTAPMTQALAAAATSRGYAESFAPASTSAAALPEDRFQTVTS